MSRLTPRPTDRNIPPGLNSEVQRANFLAAARRYWFGVGPDVRLCGAAKKDGGTCRRVALRGEDRCPVHCGPVLAAVRRARFLEKLARGEATPAQAARAARRQASSRLRRLWQREPWAPGVTLDLGEAEDTMRDAIRAEGHPLRLMPPAVLDWLRWRWRRAFMDGRQTTALWNVALRDLPGRISAAGPCPAAWDIEDTAAVPGPAYEAEAVGGQPSKRRAPNPPKVDPAPALPLLGDLSREDAGRASRALAFYPEALAPLMRDLLSAEARFHLALAFDRSLEGEIGHVEWAETLAALARR